MTHQPLCICNRIMQEMDASTIKHGDWSEYTTRRMLDVLIDEMQELTLAVAMNDVHGEHGMVKEAIQVAACAVKMIVQLERH